MPIMGIVVITKTGVLQNVMENPRHWRLKKQRYALVGEICPHCAVKIFPPRDVCPECGLEAKTSYQFSGKGKIYSYTKMTDGPAGFRQNTPYFVALIQLNEGPMITAQLTDVGDEEIKIGSPVEMVTRKLREDGDHHGAILYGYKFRPVLQEVSA